MSDEQRPKLVGPRYWLEKGVELRNGAVSSRAATAKSLAAGIAWFWSSYTAVTLAGVVVSARHFTLAQSVGVAAPSILLIAAYGAALWAQAHVAVAFIPNAPRSVEEAHDKIAAELARRLGIATVLTALAVISAAIAIVQVALPSEDSAQKLAATVLSPDTQGARLAASGVAAEGALVTIDTAGQNPPFSHDIVRADAQGRWAALLHVASRPASVSATWVKDGVETRLKIDLPP